MSAPALRLVPGVAPEVQVLRETAAVLAALGPVVANLGRSIAMLEQRLTVPEPAPEVEQKPAWIQPEAAARLAGLPMATEREHRRSVRRIYTWARSQRWASRPNKRTLLIDEAGFRRWLQARAGR